MRRCAFFRKMLLQTTLTFRCSSRAGLIVNKSHKALAHHESRKTLVVSGLESLVRDPHNPEKLRQARSTMRRITKLILRSCSILIIAPSGNDAILMWLRSRMLSEPKTIIRDYINLNALHPCNTEQRAKVDNRGGKGTTGSPKSRKRYGDGVSILGISLRKGISMNSWTQRDTGLRHYASKASITEPQGEKH